MHISQNYVESWQRIPVHSTHYFNLFVKFTLSHSVFDLWYSIFSCKFFSSWKILFSFLKKTRKNQPKTATFHSCSGKACWLLPDSTMTTERGRTFLYVYLSYFFFLLIEGITFIPCPLHPWYLLPFIKNQYPHFHKIYLLLILVSFQIAYCKHGFVQRSLVNCVFCFYMFIKHSR